MALINASIDNSKVLFSENDFWFDKITKYVGTSKLINIAANENLNNIIDDIENPFEGNIDAEKEGKKHYVLSIWRTMILVENHELETLKT